MANIDLVSMLGYTNNAYIMVEAFRSSANVILTDNPEYTKEMFLESFPVFSASFDDNTIPEYVFNLFVGMAQASIKKDRYNSAWEFLMGLYVAHNLVLYMRTQQGDPSAANALKGSLPVGIASSKSVDGLSISCAFVGLQEDFNGYGTWKLTTYIQQLITMTKSFGRAGMWING